MGADNWTICPQCKRERAEQRQQLERSLNDSYGKVPLDEYLAMQQTLRALDLQPPHEKETFREDYEIGVGGDDLYIGYTGSCQKCGFKVSFKHSKSVFDI